ncbi:hypothetical protein RRG08_042416 [Elysia crispata]|uniref:Uncharacterized protein n=1 Tax=Elysia crispata TaxID=231223 RepID=A0AAE1DDN4_9GAST|nr:hypothetical protein RRG08_042416 [Elysia crispata]
MSISRRGQLGLGVEWLEKFLLVVLILRLETEWTHISHCFKLLSHSSSLVSYQLYKKRYKSQYREQSEASKLPFDGAHVPLISHIRFTAAIKFLPQSSRDATRFELVRRRNGDGDQRHRQNVPSV